MGQKEPGVPDDPRSALLDLEALTEKQTSILVKLQYFDLSVTAVDPTSITTNTTCKGDSFADNNKILEMCECMELWCLKSHFQCAWRSSELGQLRVGCGGQK